MTLVTGTWRARCGSLDMQGHALLAAAGRWTNRARLRAPVRGSLDVELVPLGIEHGDAVLTVLRVRGDEGRPRCGQPLDGLVNAGTPVGWGRARWATRVHVEVQAVLDRFQLRYPREVDTCAVAVRIDDRAGVIPVFFRDTMIGQPCPPRGGRLGRPCNW